MVAWNARHIQLCFIGVLVALVSFSIFNFHAFTMRHRATTRIIKPTSSLNVVASATTKITTATTIMTTTQMKTTSDEPLSPLLEDAEFRRFVELDTSIPYANLIQFDVNYTAEQLRSVPSSKTPPLATVVLTVDCSKYSDWQSAIAIGSLRRLRLTYPDSQRFKIMRLVSCNAGSFEMKSLFVSLEQN